MQSSRGYLRQGAITALSGRVTKERRLDLAYLDGTVNVGEGNAQKSRHHFVLRIKRISEWLK